MAHGLLAAAALTLLIYAAATVGLPALAMAATVIFVVVAIVGAALNLNYHSECSRSARRRSSFTGWRRSSGTFCSCCRW